MKMKTAGSIALWTMLSVPLHAAWPGQTGGQVGVQPTDGTGKADEKKSRVPEFKVTSHETTIEGQSIKYTATAGMLPLLDDAGKTKAQVFFVAYERADQEVAQRPIMFAFNGGPGSASVWLHMGAIGPRRVEMGPEGEVLPPPAKVVTNEYSWLDMCDLVFIDPVSTGYSRPAEGENPGQFHGLNEDVAAVGNFIRLYCTRYQRWSSPKFLVGESYGTTRASGLAAYLQGQLGMYLNGMVLISPVLNFQTLEPDIGNDLPYWLFLPTYTATAWHYKKLDAELQGDLVKTLAEAQRWASGEYMVALSKGDQLSATERDAIAAKMARYTGVSKEFVLRHELRVTQSQFCRELLRERGMMVGRLDSRYSAASREVGDGGGGEGAVGYAGSDPSYAAIQGVYTAGLNMYLRGELKFESDQNYEILTGKVNPWSFQPAVNRYANVSDSLRQAMVQNPSLRVLFAAGYFDLATPFGATDYTVAHLGLPAELRGQVTQTYYRSGHMMYVRAEDLAKLKADAKKLVTSP